MAKRARRTEPKPEPKPEPVKAEPVEPKLTVKFVKEHVTNIHCFRVDKVFECETPAQAQSYVDLGVAEFYG